MKIITYCTAITVWLLTIFSAQAQDGNLAEDIAMLKAAQEQVVKEEKEALKSEVENINERLDKEEITLAEAEELKEQAAEKRALNIENRLAIIDNKIALLERNGGTENLADDSERVVLRIGSDTDEESYIFFGRKNKAEQYDKRTRSGIFFTAGFNDLISDGNSFGDTQFAIGRSSFMELGYNWKTRILKNSNFLRVKYGLGFQWNKIRPHANKYFVENNNETVLEEFPVNLDEHELRLTNIVIPLHFEIGPSKRIERKNSFRYVTYDQFKFGFGGYAGFNIGTQQKLKYKEDGDRVKQKIRKDYNTTDFIYGISSYIGVGSFSLYAKYDISPVFSNQDVDMNNLSIGIRVDLD